MIILGVNVGRVGIRTGAGIAWLSYASNFHHCDFVYLIIDLRKFRGMLLRIGLSKHIHANNGLMSRASY